MDWRQLDVVTTRHDVADIWSSNNNLADVRRSDTSTNVQAMDGDNMRDDNHDNK